MMTVEELKRIDLMALLSQEWGLSFRREGAGFVAHSPFREERNASFYVKVMPDGHWVFCDHSDGSDGSVIDLMMRQLGTNDFRTARDAAEVLVKRSGLSATSAEHDVPSEPEKDYEPLYRRLRKRDAAPCLEYLKRRGIDEKLVRDLIADGTLVLNIVDGSRYICFAVRDGDGKLQSLFNRQIDGPSKRDKFVLGQAHAFCQDWNSLANASAIYICEGIIDALSIVTLHLEACVVAVPGANFDLSRLDLPPDTPLIDAFDDDAAGRAAGDRLRKQYPQRPIRLFELNGFHDVNDCLLNRDRDHVSNCQLTPKDRLTISIDPRPSRVIADEYGVHHSHICNIRNEAVEVLGEHWSSKRVGRRTQLISEPEDEETKKQLAEQTRRADLLEMRNDWLELKIKLLQERAEEADKEMASRRQRNRKKKAHAKRQPSLK